MVRSVIVTLAAFILLLVPVGARCAGVERFPLTASCSNREAGEFFSAVGGGRGKVVFVNTTNQSLGGPVCYIDFAESVDSPAVREISAIEDAKVPVLSPDGRWVVYATGMGAESGANSSSDADAYVCGVAEDARPVLITSGGAVEPRFVFNPGDPSQTLEVVYSTISENVAWEGDGRVMRVEIDVSGEVPVPGTPEVFVSSGGYTGGLSWDESHICGGGGMVAMLDLRDSSDGVPDTVSFFNQACNASMSSSRRFPDVMMHLTMGGADDRIHGGRRWSTWEIIFVVNSRADILKYYACPVEPRFPLETSPVESFSDARWHHCEWSNHPYFAVSALSVERYFADESKDMYVHSSYQERLYLINLRDSLYLEVLRPDTIKYDWRGGGGIYWPFLWVDTEGFSGEERWLAPLACPQGGECVVEPPWTEEETGSGGATEKQKKKGLCGDGALLSLLIPMVVFGFRGACRAGERSAHGTC